MTAPHPTGTPRSSNLHVPATQGTAPVVKFRCLFTHDVRRKAKRWQDGFLRYHTFNKRVMVYDNTGYFIGDLHWRALEGIQDGDELELDKGVLIQVCEPLEKTETDLSELYKNKSQTSPSRPGDAPPSSLRSTPRPSQLASRSLNDLLGIRKTPAPQIRSPYERRHDQRLVSTHQLDERPAKRQRTSPERNSRPNGQPHIINLSDSPPRRRPAPDTNPEPSFKLKNQSPAVPSKPRVPPAPSTSACNSIPKQPQVPPSRSTAQSRPQNPIPPQPVAEAPKNTLRLSGDKPRRKLMYQESLRAPVRNPVTRTQIYRPHSQHQATVKHEETCNPIVILEDDFDDDPVLHSQPTSYQPIPASLERNPTLPIAKSSNETLNDSDLAALFANLSGGEQPQPSHAPPNLISLPRSGTSLPQAQHSAAAMENAHKPRSAGLRKSYSDPPTISSLHPRPLPTTIPLNPIAERSDEQGPEQGPWTEEALDLFEFWPPGRPRPS
ncbi:uncharacterized protein BDV17DRAFT_148910 [Aspergillus undulatus]|uniref:uncharacterized protein n=1 Tax=Aspergillus undulatus TaxID=1810928 RepID=UPI003CCCDEA4